jgi:stress-induced morphogen
MDLSEVEALIEEGVPEAEAAVSYARPNDDRHLSATVVSPAFEGLSLVEQHDLVYDALEEHLTTDIHALQLTTKLPSEA